MAAQSINIYLDENMSMFLDPQQTIKFPGPLYQDAADLRTYYLNEGCSITANLVGAGVLNTITDTDPVPSPSPMSANEGFNKGHTLFLIDLMQQHLETESEGLPKTLKDLNSRLNNGKGNKKQLWKDMADKLGSYFQMLFCPDKVARKWTTLVDAYKKVKDNNRSTGKGAMRFQFFSEMDQLLGGQHDVVFPVVGTSDGLEVRRPEALGHSSSSQSAETENEPVTPQGKRPRPSVTPTPPSRKRRRVDDDVLQYLKDSEEASQQRHEELLNQQKSAQQCFSDLMNKFLEKL